MPVLNTPTVSISLPVPTPVQQKPKAPQPQPVAQAPAPQPTQAPPQYPVPLQPQVSAVILPWTPTPQRMARKGAPTKIRYSHDAFLKAIRRSKGDRTPQAVYADWIEENDPDSATPETLDVLRNHQGPTWVTRSADGKVHAGRKWTMAEIRDAVTSAGGHWFDRDTMHFFRSRIHGQPIHGPGGIHFITSEATPHSNGRRFTVRIFQPAYSNFSPRIATFEFMGHPTLEAARGVARRLAAGESVDRTRMSRRLPKKVIKFSSGSSDLTHMLQYVRENPYDTNVHGPLADAIDEIDEGNPVAKLIRRHYVEGKGDQNLWYDNVYAGWDGTFPYTAKLGRHGPFKIYLGHEGDSGSGNQRWVVHALSTLPGSRDLAYAFEIPHEEAQLIPQLFPAARRYISPQDTSSDRVGDFRTNYLGHEQFRDDESRAFDQRMDEEHRNANDWPEPPHKAWKRLVRTGARRRPRDGLAVWSSNSEKSGRDGI